jgi:hypothetical protein
MDAVHAVLIVLVLVLVVLVAKDQLKAMCRRGGKKAKKNCKVAVDLADAAPAAAPSPKKPSYEDAAVNHLAENNEYFQACKSEDEISKVLDCACDDNSGAFAKNDYGAPGLDYNSFVMSQGVDNQSIRNHKEFVKDRMAVNGQGTEFTGRTWTPQPDMGDSGGYAPSSWVGIRGPPMKVPVCNPTQVNSDEDSDAFRTKRFCF